MVSYETRPSLLGLPVEARLIILGDLLPDIDVVPTHFEYTNSPQQGRLRKDGSKCCLSVRSVNHRLYTETADLLEKAWRWLPTFTLCIDPGPGSIDGWGSLSFLGHTHLMSKKRLFPKRTYRFLTTKVANLFVKIKPPEEPFQCNFIRIRQQLHAVCRMFESSKVLRHLSVLVCKDKDGGISWFESRGRPHHGFIGILGAK